DYRRLADSHVHRATREDSLGIIKGRDAITAAWIEQADLAGEVEVDLGVMVAVRAAAFGKQKAGAWHLHRWVWQEDGRILREIEITDRSRDIVARPVHPPIGELHAGRGQYAASDVPDLPPTFPDNARQLATNLHRKWNGRDLSDNIPAEIVALIRAMPDVVFLFEHAVVRADASAILFRAMGHHPNGQRVRLIGSSTIIEGLRTVVIDHAAYAAQLSRGLIDYAQ
nr:hypothetical protein [Sphingopyxis sp.]